MEEERYIGTDNRDEAYSSLFDSLPGCSLLLRNNAPHFTILAATAGYLDQIGAAKEDLIGRGILTVFTPVQDDHTRSRVDDQTHYGVSALEASLSIVQATNKTHYMAAQAYNVPVKNGGIATLAWSASNSPVYKGNDVAYIIHTAENLTEPGNGTIKDEPLADVGKSMHDLYSLVLQAPIGICVMNAETLIAEIVNATFAEIAGRSVEEIVGQGYWATFVDAKPYYEDELDRVVREGVQFRADNVEVPLLRYGKKELLTVSFVYEPLKDLNGITKKVVVWVENNTSQIQSLKKLEESEIYFRQLTDTIPVIVWITGVDGRCTYLNSHWYDYTGQTQQEAEGYGWLSVTHPDDKLSSEKIFREANEKQEAFTLFYRLRSVNGDYRWCKDSGSPKFSKDGAFEGFIGTVVDVHEEKVADEKLRESESRLRALVNASSDVIYGLSADWEIMQPLDGRGFLADAIAPVRNWMEINVHPADMELVKKNIASAIRNKKIFELEHRVRTIDGSTGWTFSRAIPILDEHGNIREWFGTATDITKRKSFEESLTESESRLRNVINATPVGTAILIGPDLKIETANEVIMKFWKKDSSVLGMPLKEALPELAGQPFPDLLSNVYQTGLSHTDNAAHAYFVNPQGVSISAYFNHSYTPLRDVTGVIYGVLIMAVDVTEEILIRKKIEESESRFRSLADQSPMFVFLIEPDASQTVNYWNQTWMDYTGKSVDEARGTQWKSVIHPDDLSTVTDIYTAAYQNREPFLMPAIRTKRYDGVYRRHAYKGNPRYAPDGSFNGYVGVGFDVHEQEMAKDRLEALVNQRTIELHRSNDDLQQFAHVASHDLKEPVRKVKTFTSRLEKHLEDKLDETSSRYIEKIHSGTNRMLTMIEGVLTYSTFSNTIQAPEEIDLNEVIKSIETDLEVLVQKTGTQLIYSSLPIIEGSPVLIYQLFYNLINNAIKFGKADVSPRIELSSDVVNSDYRQYAKLTLADNGIGFDREQATVIFDTFTRLNSKDKYEGTGLGLALCKKIVERHSGSISATGVPGEGARFIILLPFKQIGSNQ